MRLVPGNVFKNDRLFNDFWAPMAWEEGFMEDFFAPKVDVKECKDHFEILAELPGVEKDDIKVNLVDGALVIEAEAKQEDKEEKNGKLIRQERRYGKLMRRFNLDPGVKEDEIEAKFKDGVLKLIAPKRNGKVVAEKHRIEIH
ncbi:MAG: Hsp20/alpha crystallin family protein [Halieaceae bacterium]